METITDIIAAAGGAEVIAAKLPKKVNKRTGEKVDRASAVYKWKKLGIPERHWPLLLKLSDEITVDALFAANRRARGEKIPRKRKPQSERAAA
jgi:hypothetical protein